MNKEELIVEAIKRYPVETIYRCGANNNSLDNIITDSNEIKYIGGSEPTGIHYLNTWLYVYGKWADIISSPISQLINNYDPY